MLKVEQPLQRTVGRREINRGVVSLTISALLYDCSRPKVLQPPATPTAPEQISARGLARLKESVADLPDSVYKQLLISRIIPFYQDSRNRTVDYGGQAIEVYSPSLSIITGGEVTGNYNFRHLESPNNYRLVNGPAEVLIPALNLYSDSEKNLPLFRKVGDESAVRISGLVLSQVYSGISPQIVVTTLPDSRIPANSKESFAKIEKLTYIKEGLNQLVYDFYIEQIIVKCRELGLPVTMTLIDSSGMNKEVEIITHCLTALHNNGGRSVAAFDVAGYLLAMKAAQGSALQEVNLNNPNLAALVPIVERVDFGQTPAQILANVLKMILETPEMSRLTASSSSGSIINGVFSKLP